ncbi:MAG: tetratricopeptide repeat protein [Planctomycetes bacterium]|nr:tetratricopeptide repeat protein [Planctomycetota bacterium]
MSLIDWAARWSRGGDIADRVLALAWELHTAGRLEEALGAFLRAVEEAPASAAAIEGLGWCRLARGEYMEADDAFARAAALDPDSTVPATGRAIVIRWRYETFHQAWALYYQARYAEAVAAFDAILADPTLRLPARESWKVLSGLGWCHYALGDYRRAAGRFGMILDFEKDNPFALRGLGLCKYHLGEHAVAIPLLERAAASSDAPSECLAFVGWSHYALGRWDEALEAFRRAHAAGPWSGDPIYGIGWSLYRKGEVEAAREPLRQAVTLLPRHPSTRFLLAEIRARGPEWRDLYRLLGSSLHRSRDYAGAREVFREALESCPEAPDLLLGLGLASFRLGRHQEALETLTRAVERGAGELEIEEILALPGAFTEYPMKTDAPSTIAWCLYSLDRAGRAAEVFREAIARRPDWPYLHTGLGWSLLKLGRFEEAERAFRETLGANPQYPEALKGLAEVRKWRYADSEAAWDAFYRGERAEAREAFERVLAERPPRLPPEDACRVRVGLAEIAAAEDRKQEAARHLEEALAQEPGNRLVRERLAALLAPQDPKPETPVWRSR